MVETTSQPRTPVSVMICTRMPTVTSTAASASGVPENVASTALRNSARGVRGNAASAPITRTNGLAGSMRTSGKTRTETQIATITASGTSPCKLAATLVSAPGAAADGLVGPQPHLNQASAASASG